MAKTPQRFRSADEALTVLLPERNGEPRGPAGGSVAPDDPWPEGEEIASDVLSEIRQKLASAAETSARSTRTPRR
jgi:hypothetical protein